MRSGGQGDKHIEMQVTELVGGVAMLGAYLCQYLARFQPVSFRGRQKWMILSKRPKKLSIGRCCGATPQFGQDDGRVSDQATQGLDSPPMTTCAQVVDEYRRVKNDEVTHRGWQTRVCLRFSSSEL